MSFFQRDPRQQMLLGSGERVSGAEVREQNVQAAVSIANIVKTSLGPHGLDKMMVDDIGVSLPRTLSFPKLLLVSREEHSWRGRDGADLQRNLHRMSPFRTMELPFFNSLK